MIMKYPVILMSITTLLLTGCDIFEEPEPVDEYFIEAYLIANKPADGILVSEISSFEEEYRFEDNVVNNAEISIFKLNDDSTRAERYEFQNQSDGKYTPSDSLVPEPLRTYELEVIIPDDDTLHAFTTVPDTFSINSSPDEPLEYTRERQLSVDFSGSYYPGRESLYLFSTESLKPDSYKMTPEHFTADEKQQKEAIVTRSQFFSENMLNPDDDQGYTVDYPLASTRYYGPNEITLYAVDDGFYEFYQSQEIQLGDGGLSPGQIRNVDHNIINGKGLFGSLAGSSFEMYLSQPDDYTPSED